MLELNKYWHEHPPLHILLQGIASGMAGFQVGGDVGVPSKAPPVISENDGRRITSTEELMSMIPGLNLPPGAVGVIHGG